MSERRTRSKVLGLSDERLRRLEKRFAALEGAAGGAPRDLGDLAARLDQAVDVLTRLVRVVVAHHAQTKRGLTQIGDRADRVTRAVATGRTADLRRLAQLERRLQALERALP